MLRKTGDETGVGGAAAVLGSGSEGAAGGVSAAGSPTVGVVVLAWGATGAGGTSRGRHAKNKPAAPSARPAAKLTSTLRLVGFVAAPPCVGSV